ncbi:hypothetical protein CEXT_806481 [Caerostris extrusa]|uniref:Uncharacterized protein n=1 Tax=Caerostris extrusa TaxID=172846 RepID=A0AAV4UCI4_CAEEX|nr:hypothetical protein CEXT_806481 [Caerostris extrusa]
MNLCILSVEHSVHARMYSGTKTFILSGALSPVKRGLIWNLSNGRRENWLQDFRVPFNGIGKEKLKASNSVKINCSPRGFTQERALEPARGNTRANCKEEREVLPCGV